MIDRDAYDKKMDALALRIAKACDGEDKFDVASACTMVAMQAILDRSDLTRDQKSALMETIIEHMLNIFRHNNGVVPPRRETIQ